MSRASDQLGRVLSGRYHLLAPLGAGASAQVYLAEDTQLHRRVAVKVLHASLVADPVVRRRFDTESRAAAAVNHPHLLAIYDVGDDDGPYLVTEYLAGGSLRGILDGGVSLTPSQALLVGLEAARGLEHAHQAGLIHRDIKPANLLFGADGRLRIGDFGLARVLAEAALTEPGGSPLGTARYASPEQARGDAVSPATDIYSLALVLCEAVTGEVPFTADTPMGGLVARTERSLSVPDTLGPLRTVLERAGRLDPATRPDAGDLAVSLLAAAEHLPRPESLPLCPPPLDLTEIGAAATASVIPSEPTTFMAVDDDSLITAIDSPTTRVPVFANPDDAVVAARTSSATPLLYDQALEEPKREPRRGLAVFIAVLIIAAIGAGAAFAWWQNQTPTHDVPVLEGATRDQLDALLGDDGWKTDIRETRQDGTEPGEIVAQDPAAGTALAEGETIVITVSLGNTLVPFPDDIVGSNLNDVKDHFAEIGLEVGEVTRTFDEEVKSGDVISLAEGFDGITEVPKGSTVDMTVSDGPPPRTLPDFTGVGRDDAAAQLEGLGLVAVVTEEASRDVALGVVIRTDPGVDAAVEKGGEVTLVVSSGLPYINVPDVVGMDVDEATQVLEDANLVVAGVEGPPSKKVVSTVPATDVPIQEGNEVTLVTRTPPKDSDTTSTTDRDTNGSGND